MFVRDVMQTSVVTVTPETTLPEATRLASRRGIRHLPVLEDGKLVGILSDRDLKRAMASPATSLEAHELTYLLDRLTIRQLMTRAVIVIGPMFPIEDAARLMVQEKIGALPVTDGDRLVGIVTETDVLSLFVRALGAGEPSSRLDLFLGARPDALTEVTRTIEEAGATLASIMTLRGPDGAREAIVRIATINPGPAIAALQAKGYAIRDGHRDREILPRP
jgi:acetoin utilization protein AcuB